MGIKIIPHWVKLIVYQKLASHPQVMFPDYHLCKILRLEEVKPKIVFKKMLIIKIIINQLIKDNRIILHKKEITICFNHNSKTVITIMKKTLKQKKIVFHSLLKCNNLSNYLMDKMTLEEDKENHGANKNCKSWIIYTMNMNRKYRLGKWRSWLKSLIDQFNQFSLRYRRCDGVYIIVNLR